MKSAQIVKFVIDKELDIANHFVGINAYKRNMDRGFEQRKKINVENLLKLSSQDEVRTEIEKTVEPYYGKMEKLNSLVNDINSEWVKIEKDFIHKLETVHKFPFPETSIRGVLSSTDRFGYNTEGKWFAANMFGSKFICIDTATHELMHFMFHRYYDKVCQEKGLTKDQMWDVQEAFTVLLNIEFAEFRFQLDNGYAPHLKLREVIKNSWKRNRDFDKALDEVITYVKNTIK